MRICDRTFQLRIVAASYRFGIELDYYVRRHTVFSVIHSPDGLTIRTLGAVTVPSSIRSGKPSGDGSHMGCSALLTLTP
jgi:hypothetical protein